MKSAFNLLFVILVAGLLSPAYDLIVAQTADYDEDGFTSDVDCNDDDATINPAMSDIPGNGIDEDCSGADTPFADDDEDGFTSDVDCNDDDATINPAAEEIANDGIDQDCNGEDLIQPTEVILSADKDSFIRNGAKNTDEGSNTILMVQKAGNKRSLISFDLSEYGGNQVTSATLKLYVTYNGGNWGKHNDRMIEVHKLLSDWSEGNGANFIPKNIDEDDEPEKTKGTGLGVTWNCSTDSNISNKKIDCNQKWNGGKYAQSITDSEIITSTTLGQWIEFDVTGDVNSLLSDTSHNFGWLIKKSNENNSGRLAFASSENANSDNHPQLVLKFG